MCVRESGAVVRFFLRILRFERSIAAVFAVAAVAGVIGALHVRNDASIDSLIVPTDPVARATREFESLFPEGEHALLLLDAPDPVSPQARLAAGALAAKLAAIPGVEAQSLAGSELQAGPTGGSQAGPTGGLQAGPIGGPGDRSLGIGIELEASSAAERDRALDAIDAAAAGYLAPQGPFSSIHRVGSPWLEAWLEHATVKAQARVMPLFGLFLMALILALYRSWRTLAAIVLTLAAVVAIATGLAGLFGWPHTVVSALVPLTVMVTTTATLVYLHSRYIERDDSPTLAEHHARALANKLLPCTASMLATAIGFAALAVSAIRPIREMGLWTASGLAAAWAGCFFLFPALQSLLKTPLRGECAPAARWYPSFVDRWVPFTRRHRRSLVGVTLALTACGAVALFGVRGFIAPLPLQTDVLTYIDPDVPVAKDTREYEKHSGLAVLELWLQLPRGEALSAAALRAIGHLTQALERDPRITTVEGPGSLGGRFVVQTDVTNVRLSIRGRDTAFGPVGAMRAYIERTLHAVQLAEPALREASGRVVGKVALSQQITLELVPTLVESFALTAGVIFCVFLLVFRSASARLMAMIPSVFAILAAFLVMRVTGMSLNIATILIGSTVLGATENDQVHFFYHFQEARAESKQRAQSECEARPDEGTAAALRHAFRVAGRPILFATLINAAGFLALSLSDLPPMREFGIVSATAFLLALAADFTALPAALWLLDRSGRVLPAVRTQLSGGQPGG